jgi:hypothetical protein
MIMIENADLAARFLAVGLGILFCPAFIQAEAKGFQTRHFAEVDSSISVR